MQGNMFLLPWMTGAWLGATTTAIIPSPPVVADVTHSSPSSLIRPDTTITVVSPSQYENYLPRLLYPGTYGNYCGPTPEVSFRNGCVAHGWHGDIPVDAVDEVCRLHDISYCKCQGELMKRRTQQLSVQLPTYLSSLTAIRFWTQSLLLDDNHNDNNDAGGGMVDAEYIQCVNRADRELIASGIRLRGELQRQGCQSSTTTATSQLSAPTSSSDNNLKWFCSPEKAFGILSRFEKVSLSIFLRSLDADVKTLAKEEQQQNEMVAALQQGMPSLSLVELEHARQMDFRQALKKNGNRIEDAANGVVQQDDDRILQRLGQAFREAS